MGDVTQPPTSQFSKAAFQRNQESVKKKKRLSAKRQKTFKSNWMWNVSSSFCWINLQWMAFLCSQLSFIIPYRNGFCSTSLPLASTRWAWLTLSSLCPLLKAVSVSKSSEKFLRMPRIKPGAPGWEASMLPLCYASPAPTLWNCWP